MKVLRIIGKALCWITAALLIVLSISAFYGILPSNASIGVLFAAFALDNVGDAIALFKKPTRQYLRYVIYYEDGSQDSFIVPIDHKTTYQGQSDKSIDSLSVYYFESDKKEEIYHE